MMTAIAGQDRPMSLVIFSIVIFDDMTRGTGYAIFTPCNHPAIVAEPSVLDRWVAMCMLVQPITANEPRPSNSQPETRNLNN
jgi:hypothetical protein